MELKFLPFSMYAEGFVSSKDADTLEKYIDDDLLNVDYKSIKSQYHNFLTTSPVHSESDDNILWDKYKNILTPYIESFITKITDNVNRLDLSFYLNLCKKGSFISPHYDGNDSNHSFMMLYCPKKYEKYSAYTTYLTSEKYHQTFSKFEKLPMTQENSVDFYHERGKFFIIPSNLLHWVTTISDEVDRITIMARIEPEFKL